MAKLFRGSRMPGWPNWRKAEEERKKREPKMMEKDIIKMINDKIEKLFEEDSDTEDTEDFLKDEEWVKAANEFDESCSEED